MPTSRFIPYFLCVLVALSFACSARQQQFQQLTALETSHAALQRRLDELSLRIEHQEKLLEDVSTSERGNAADTRQDLRDLQAELQVLEGKVELHAHDLLQLKEPRTPKSAVKSSEPPPAATPAQEQRHQELANELSKVRAQLTALNEDVQGLRAARSFELGRSEYGEGRWEQALGQFQLFLEHHGSDDRVDLARFYLADCYFQLDNYLRAIAAFQEMIDKHPTSSRVCPAHFRQGMAFSRLGEYRNAKLFLEDVLHKCPAAAPERVSAEEEITRLTKLLGSKAEADKGSKKGQGGRSPKN
ncbi:MAG: hypothetical protein A2284_00560 [Deltaproteobacteria bacterium RIFOXYA12_FULL_61_11]|nr:MAG: hypothetical protein A2284_00560 [Deltaproteobacteria bacterium RIFOXYA12_FULL_61_11]